MNKQLYARGRNVFRVLCGLATICLLAICAPSMALAQSSNGPTMDELGGDFVMPAGVTIVDDATASDVLNANFQASLTEIQTSTDVNVVELATLSAEFSQYLLEGMELNLPLLDLLGNSAVFFSENGPRFSAETMRSSDQLFNTTVADLSL